MAGERNDCRCCPGVSLVSGRGGMPEVHVSSACAGAEVSLHGAHLLSYTPAGEAPLIFLSEKAEFRPDKAVRGGVPLCWPWFGAAKEPGLPAHGYARLAEWELSGSRLLPDGTVALQLVLPQRNNPVPLTQVTFNLFIGRQLMMILQYENLGREPLEISDALHTYFAVSDIEKVSVSGLSGLTYTDKLTGADAVQSGDIAFSGETDRIYHGAAGVPVTVDDAGLRRRIRIEQIGNHSTVVWNPWVEKSRRLADFGDDEYLRMVCVESAHAPSEPVTAEPHRQIMLGQKISVSALP